MYFGSVQTALYKKAMELFAAHRVKIGKARTQNAAGISVSELVEKFVEWVHSHRGTNVWRA